MEYSMILILRVQSSFPRTGTNCETGKTPILFRLVLLTVQQPEEFCYPAGLVAALHFSLVSKLRLNISSHCCDTTEVQRETHQVTAGSFIVFGILGKKS